MSHNHKVNWGILATGRIAGKFAEALTVVPGATKYAVASRTQKKAEKFQKDYQFKKAYSSYQQLLNDPAIDIVYIATPHHDHVKWSIEALDAGKAVLCEKPLGLTLQSVEKLLKRAEQGTFFMEALWTRFLPHFLKVDEWIIRGKIGEIKSIHADFGFPAPFNPEARLFNKDLGGGSLLDVGIYPVFLSWYFLGIPQEVKAMAYIGKTGVDEQCQMIFSYPNQATATLSSSIVSDDPVEAHINGTKGRITIHTQWHGPSSATLYQTRHEETEHYTFTPGANGYEYEIMEVNNCMIHGKQQSDDFTIENSRQLFTILQHVMEQAGIRY